MVIILRTSYWNPLKMRIEATCKPKSTTAAALISTNVDNNFNILPYTIIYNIANYLTEDNIQQLGECNRELFMATHQTSFFISHNQCKTENAPQFAIGNKMLEHMNEYLIHHPNGQMDHLFKYSKCQTLSICIDCGIMSDLMHHAIHKCYKPGEYNAKTLEIVNDEIEKYQKYFENILNKAPQWFNDMMSQIKTLNIEYDGVTIMNKLPINLLFDPEKSKLETIIINNTSYFSQDFNFARYIVNELDETGELDEDDASIEFIKAPFEEFDSKFNQKTLKSKCRLKTVKYKMDGNLYKSMDDRNNLSSLLTDSRYEMLIKHQPMYFDFQNQFEHLYMCYGCIYGNQTDLNKIFHPNLKTFTIDRGIDIFKGFNKDISFNPVFDPPLQIRTLRFINIDDDHMYFAENKKIVKSFNLNQSVQNVLFHYLVSRYDQYLSNCINSINMLIAKKRLKNIQNLVVLVDFHDDDDSSWNKIEKLLNALKRKSQKLKQMYEDKKMTKFIVGLSFCSGRSCFEQQAKSASVFGWSLNTDGNDDVMVETSLAAMEIQFKKDWQQRNQVSFENASKVKQYEELLQIWS